MHLPRSSSFNPKKKQRRVTRGYRYRLANSPNNDHKRQQVRALALDLFRPLVQTGLPFGHRKQRGPECCGEGVAERGSRRYALLVLLSLFEREGEGRRRGHQVEFRERNQHV